ncbi:MAG: transcription factor FapR [Limnochordia bacterium]|jgi:acyl-coenzyme A thioesterase PaaI-like protein
MKLERKERRRLLKKRLEEDPFLTDTQLADEFQVSVATIRLDRMALNIPELRERAKSIAAETYSQVRALSGEELIGDAIDIELGKQGISILAITESMVFERTGIARGHLLFAQGNSLAVAVVNSELALTKTAAVRYHKPVYLGQRVVAKAQVLQTDGPQYLIQVESKVHDELVFSGEFTVVDVESKGGARRGQDRS